MRPCSLRLRLMRLPLLMLLLWVHVASTQTSVSPSTVAHPAFPAGTASVLGQQVAAIVAEPGVVRAHWGIAVSAMDGTPIFGLNAGEYFRPASNAKLFTTAAAMHLLGSATRTSTVVITTTPVKSGGLVEGDIALIGNGDANLSGRTLPYIAPSEHKLQAPDAKHPSTPANPLRYIDDMAASVAAKGIKHIRGNVIGNDTFWPWEPYANDWSIDDAVWGYGAPVSALTLDDNQLDLTIQPGTAPGQPATAKLTPETGYYSLQMNVKTIAAKQPASIRIDRSIGSRVLRIVGTVPMAEPYSTEIAIEDPAQFAAQALKTALQAHGIRVDGKALAVHRESDETRSFSNESREPLPDLPRTPVQAESNVLQPGSIVAQLASPTLSDDVVLTLKVSQNLHAEMLLRRLGRAYGTEGSTAQGARVVRQFLLNAGLDGDDFAFYDGSGLSGHDLVTPRATAQLLAYAAQQPWFATWKAGLPVGGEDGTLASRFSTAPLKDHLFAKTGTLAEVRALSGYVDCASGKTVIFSVMVDNHAPNTPADREAIDRIVAAIAAAN